MINTLRKALSRTMEQLLPKVDAAAGCPPDCYIQTNGEKCRRCCYRGDCTIHCGAWYSC